MTRQFSFLRDTRHLQALAFGIISVGIVLGVVRNQLLPKSWGEHGPYRGKALQDVSNRSPVLTADAHCLKCHDNVREERAQSPHAEVACHHCHGNGHEHISRAEKASQQPGSVIDKAKPWDGDFMTKLDLFITKDRATCLSCHERVVGMPAGFRSISVRNHLEEQGAENADNPDVCFECHTGHSPGI